MHRYNGALLSEKIEIENFTEAHLKVSESHTHMYCSDTHADEKKEKIKQK